MRALIIAAAVFIACASMPGPMRAAEPARVALLVANKAYGAEVGPLINPHNDIALIKSALLKVGFAESGVTVVYDANRVDLLEAFESFAAKVRQAGSGAISFVYYSGHGAANDRRENYLIPVDAPALTARGFWHHSVSLEASLAQMSREAPDARHFVVFDACRNTLKLREPGGKNLAQPKGFEPVRNIPGGMLIAYATAEGELASDAGARAGPYAIALAEEIVKPGIEAITVFRNAQLRVSERIDQKPWVQNSPMAATYFAGREAPPVAPKPAEQQVAAARPEPLTGNFLATGGYEDKKKRLLRTLEGHGSTVTAAAFSPDGKTVVSASGDKTVKLWDAATGRLMRTLDGHGEIVWGAAFSPDGETVVSASGDKNVNLWDAATGRLIRTLELHGDSVMAAAFSPDGEKVVAAVGSEDKTLKLWDAATGQLLHTLEGHAWDVMAAAFSPDGKMVVSASADKTVRLWDVATGRLIRTLKGHQDRVRASAFSPNGKTIISGSEDHTVKLWDATTGRLIRTLDKHGSWVSAAAFSPNGKALVSASGDNTVKLWDAATGRRIQTIQAHGHGAEAATFSPDGKTVASAGCDVYDDAKFECAKGTVKLWDVSEWTAPKTAARP